MSRYFVSWVLVLLVLPSPVWAVEPAPALSDREIAERLTRLEEGLKGVQANIGLLRSDIGLLREDMNRQFDRQLQLTLALLGVFFALVAAIIGFAFWDRRTMIRPVERAVKSLEEEFATNRRHVQGLLEALRSLGQRNPEVATVLKQFNLL